MRWTLPLALQLAAVAHGAVEAVPLDEGPDPGLFLFALAAFGVTCLLVGIGLVLAAVAMLSLAVLALAGVVSTSVCVGLCRRRLSSGLRMLHYQLAALAAAPAGIAVLWGIDRWRGGPLGAGALLGLGALGGAGAGLLLAWGLDRLAGGLARAVMRRVAPRVRE